MRRRYRQGISIAAAACVLAVHACAHAPETPPPAALTDSAFADLVQRLSEPGGFFDTDNLISNEDAYLHPVTTMARLGVSGGVYVGVGPDQNFSYIAAARPRVAFIVDIRRDNQLHHLMYKALFARARTRVEYLSLLFGVPAPSDTAGWGGQSIDGLLAYVDTVTTAPSDAQDAIARVQDALRAGPVTLTDADTATIARIHRTFIAQGPALRFNTFGRAPSVNYPDLRRLLLETDLRGRQANYLAREADFQFLKALQARNLVIPVVGDFAGTHALAGVAAWVREHGERVSVFYASNVEQYLLRGGAFGQYVANISALPRDAGSVMIRSYFQGGHPQSVPGYHVTQVVQHIDAFVAAAQSGGFRSYYDLTTRDIIAR